MRLPIDSAQAHTPAMKLVPLAVCILLAAPLSAHPHVWVDVQAEVVVAQGVVDGVWTEWTFDDMFSQLILTDNDPNGTGKVDAKMNASIKKGYFDNLRNFDYFSHFEVGKRELKVPVPQKFQATITPEGRVKYRFYLPLAAPLGPSTFSVSFYDDSYFTDMVFQKTNPVVLTVSGGTASVTLKPDKSKTYYGGAVTPIYAVVSWNPS
jgi:ABC-type uncharacterized transport system substrate-binding protein